MVSGKVLPCPNQGKDDRQARAAYRRRCQEKSASAWFSGAFLRPVLLRGTADPLVRTDRTFSGWTNYRADAEAGQEASDGAGCTYLRSGNDRSVLQHRGGNRRGRPLPGEIPQTPYSSLPSGFLGKVLFHA